MYPPFSLTLTCDRRISRDEWNQVVSRTEVAFESAIGDIPVNPPPLPSEALMEIARLLDGREPSERVEAFSEVADLLRRVGHDVRDPQVPRAEGEVKEARYALRKALRIAHDHRLAAAIDWLEAYLEGVNSPSERIPF